MSEVQQDQSVEQQDQSVELQPTKSAEELVKRLQEVSAEAKEYRKKAAEYKRQLEDDKKKTLQESGQFKELADIRAREADLAKNQAKALKDAFTIKTASDALALEAAKIGCVDVDALVGLVNLGQVPVDENFQVDKNSVKAIVEDFKKQKPYFFQKEAPKFVDANPAKVEEPKLDLNKYSLAEKAALLSQLKKQGK